VVDTALNQMIDAGTAAAAGGGFIASGVRLQARGGGSVVRFSPGEYKTVDVSGGALRDAMVERTLPQVSPVTFQVLDMILGAARDISGVKDVITGDASNMGQVGTTLALIEQGLQVYNACYKRIFRAGKEEFTLLYRNIAKYGGEEAERDYMTVLDDPEANFEQDFNSADFDIRPVTDPNSVTQMQRAAKAQFLMSTLEPAVAAGGNAQEIMTRVYQAFNVEDIEKIFPPMPPPQPDPVDMAKAAETAAKIPGHEAKAALTAAQTEQTKLTTMKEAVGLGMEMGVAA
jgi:chaperonin GroES